MRKIRCPECGTRLKLPESFAKSSVKCPKCNFAFALTDNEQESEKSVNSPFKDLEIPDASEFESLANEAEFASAALPPSTKPVDSIVSNEAAKDELPEEQTESTTKSSDTFANLAAQQVAAVATKTPTTLDFGFNRFWTPAIIKGSWVTMLILTGLWIAYFGVSFVGSFFGAESPSISQAVGLPDIGSLDLEGILSGQNPQGANNLLDSVAGGSNSAAQPSRSLYHVVMAGGLSLLGFVTTIASLILSVLFCRVFFEMIIVLFDISKTLKRIEQKDSSEVTP